MKFYCEETSAVLQELDSTAEGLSSQEAAHRAGQYGPNKLKEGKKILPKR